MIDLREAKVAVVTGGLGFIGSRVVNQLLSGFPNLTVINVDSETYAADHGRVKPTDKYRFVRLDIRDSSDVVDLFRKVSPDVVFHLAAESHVDRSIVSAEEFIQTNVQGTANILDAIVRSGNKTAIIHVSTDEVYGNAEGTREYVESDMLNPQNPYSASKAAAEHLVASYGNTYGVRWLITRGCNTYGSQQNGEKFIPKLVGHITATLDDSEFTIYGDGSQVREWLHVDDHAEGIILVAQRGGEKSITNLGSGKRASNKAVVAQVIEVAREMGVLKNEEIKEGGVRLGHDSRYAINSNRANGLGWVPLLSGEPLNVDAIKEILSS